MKTFSPTDLKAILPPIFLLLALTHALVPLLIATFGSPDYFALQTLKQTSEIEKHILDTRVKELKLVLNFEKSMLNFALKMATLEKETRIKEMKTLFQHEVEMMNVTMYARS